MPPYAHSGRADVGIGPYEKTEGGAIVPRREVGPGCGRPYRPPLPSFCASFPYLGTYIATVITAKRSSVTTVRAERAEEIWARWLGSSAKMGRT